MISEKHFFNPIGTAFINVRFAYPYCQAEINSGYLDVHAPNFAARESKDSYINEDHESTCDECGENFWMTMYVGNDDAYIEVENPEEISNIKIDEISEEELEYQSKQFDAISANTHLFQTFKSGIDKLKKLNGLNLNDELEYILKLQIYTGIISTMETSFPMLLLT
jgi:hypothetical protein